MLKKLVFLTKWIVTLGITLSLPLSKAQADPIDNNVDLVDSIKPFTPDVSVIGSASDNAPTEFHVSLKMRDLGGLQARIDQGEQISPEELEQRYYPTKEDYQKIVQWLQTKGFSVETFPHRLLIIVQGKVNQVQNTLGVNLKQVMVEGKTYLATDKPPRIPRSMKSMVLGINGLQPYLHAHRSIQSVQPLSLTTPFVPPYSISDLKTAYGINRVALNGSGQRMGIVVTVFPYDSDLSTFWRNQNIPQSLNNIEKVCTGLSSSCNGPLTEEETLDTEMASGLAPAAKVRIYATGSLSPQAFDEAYSRLVIDQSYSSTKLQQVSVSYGFCEQSISPSQVLTDYQFFKSLAALGVTVLAASGDNGAFGDKCPSNSSSFSVDYPASDVNVTSVGGTRLSLNSNGTVFTEFGWSGSGGGTSSYFSRPSWQVGPGVPTGTQRLVPDVSVVADPKTGVYIYWNGSGDIVGGTSAAAPLWNAMTALINQNRSNLGLPPLGNLAPRLYPLINTPNLRDITIGSNGGFLAGPGYDQVTGVGVPVFNQLVNTLSQF
ncbi:MAG: S53 family peptidase [Rhizonema sp. PD37]|nr:S53 family peptidase [Rhizonema sp. PD37]